MPASEPAFRKLGGNSGARSKRKEQDPQASRALSTVSTGSNETEETEILGLVTFSDEPLVSRFLGRQPDVHALSTAGP